MAFDLEEGGKTEDPLSWARAGVGWGVSCIRLHPTCFTSFASSLESVGWGCSIAKPALPPAWKCHPLASHRAASRPTTGRSCAVKWAVQGKENQRPDPGWATLMHFPVQHISPGLGIEKASLRSRISQGGREFAPG